MTEAEAALYYKMLKEQAVGIPQNNQVAVYNSSSGAYEFKTFPTGMNTLKKIAIQTINGTAFQDIADLTFPVVNGTNYAFKYYIVFQSAATTTGFRFGLNCPTGTLDYFHTYQTIANSSTVGVATWLQRHDVTRDAMTATTATITAGVDLVCIFEGRYLCTADGTFAPRVASELANNDLTIRIGSWGMWF